MKRLLCCFSWSLWLVPLCGAQNFHPESVEDSVLQVVVATPGQNGQASPLAMGSGFIAGDGKMVVTAAHVYWQSGQAASERHLAGIFAYKVLVSGKKFIVPLTALKVDDEHDLAVLKFDPSQVKSQVPEFLIKPLSISEEPVKVGDEVVLVGYIEFYSFLTSIWGRVAGELKSPIPPQFTVDEIILGIGVNRGCSGSPVLSLATGKVVAVVVGFIPIPTTTPGQSTFAAGVSRAAKSKFLAPLLQP